MKKQIFPILALLLLLLSGCEESNEKKAKPTFMFWCFRKEIVSADYSIPDMNSPQIATYIQRHLKSIPGFVDSRVQMETHTLTVDYQSSVTRKMNFEEAIAQMGFRVNNRPANPKAKAVRIKEFQKNEH